MRLRSTHGRIGSVHVVIKCEHCGENIWFHTSKWPAARSLQAYVVGIYRKDKINSFSGRFVRVIKYRIFSVTFGLPRIGFKLIGDTLFRNLLRGTTLLHLPLLWWACHSNMFESLWKTPPGQAKSCECSDDNHASPYLLPLLSNKVTLDIPSCTRPQLPGWCTAGN